MYKGKVTVFSFKGLGDMFQIEDYLPDGSYSIPRKQFVYQYECYENLSFLYDRILGLKEEGYDIDIVDECFSLGEAETVRKMNGAHGNEVLKGMTEIDDNCYHRASEQTVLFAGRAASGGKKPSRISHALNLLFGSYSANSG